MAKLRKKCITEARKAVAESVNEDDFIIQSITNMEDLDKTINGLVARVREWYGFYYPELAVKLKDNRKFIELISEKSRDELMKEQGHDTMGADFTENDLAPVKSFIKSVESLMKTREEIETYLESLMNTYCMNMTAVAGPKVGAKLLAEAGSLKKLALMPSTGIQLLGAEKALFRHLKTGAKPPRHGHIFAHPLIQKTPDANRGKVARVLADKIALAVRADYFGENFIADELNKELEERFNGA